MKEQLIHCKTMTCECTNESEITTSKISCRNNGKL